MYTTNHKRIAVNYFWFVILSGIVGMVLATAIRLEFAYPGVGIFAGDSLQYLTVASAHGVVMVFFMIMPLLFGAFGNFLLPTQLGVHDVAFPRLNSAAFWFLPAGLLMLAQMVCLDRRFQRINCFNMRELQSLLKQRFFDDLVLDNLYQKSLHKTLISLRFKDFFSSSYDTSIFLYSRFSLKKEHARSFFFSDSPRPSYLFLPINFDNINIAYLFSFINFFHSSYNFLIIHVWYAIVYLYFNLILPILLFFFDFYINQGCHITKTALFQSTKRKIIHSAITYYDDLLTQLNVLSFHLISSFNTAYASFSFLAAFEVPLSFIFSFILELIHTFIELIILFKELFSSIFANLDSQDADYIGIKEFIGLFFFKVKFSFDPIFVVFETFFSPLQVGLFINFDFFFSIVTKQSAFFYNFISLDNVFSFFINNSLDPYLSFFETTYSIRGNNSTMPIFKYDYRSGDYFPKLYRDSYGFLFSSLINITGGLVMAPWYYSSSFITNLNQIVDTFSSPSRNHISPSPFYLQSIFFFWNPVKNIDLVITNNSNFMALNSLTQSFMNHFLTSSIQQRVYANWRNLKFSRESWRCKALVARHQKNLMHRYLSEDNLFWSIERNARDLLPGWAMITPFSSRTRFTAIGKVDIGLMGVLFVLNSSVISGSNFLLTYRYLSTLNNRKMRDARSFFAEGIMVTSWMMIAANPMLIIGIIMLFSDRHWQTSFFDYSGGGDTILFQHMFWFFGHPEVYVIMIPIFGFTNTLLSYYLRKRVSARASLMYSMYTIAFLGFFVWGHHMYMVGLAHTTRMLFSTLTVMISVPAATKLMHWCVTLANSAFILELPLLLSLTFIFFFVSGGISGMCVAHTGMDVLFHDTFYVIGHFHVMLAGGAMFGSFGAFYFYFPSIFGVKYSRLWSYLHYFYYLLGQLLTVVPMFWLGYSGMPRRVLDYPSSMGGWHSLISAGHLISVAGMICFFIMIFESLRKARANMRNTFGINRYNIRLNFYLYMLARLEYFRQRYSWFLRTRALSLLYRQKNLETLETTLITYRFF